MPFDTKVDGVTEETQALLDDFFYIMRIRFHIEML